MLRLVLKLCVFQTFFLSTIISAEIYQWRDENGKLHFGDMPPEKQKTEKVELEPLNISDEVRVDEKRKTRERNEQLIEKQKKEDEKSSVNVESLAKKCKRAEKKYIELKWGESPTASHTVLTGDDGKAISRKRQNEIAEKIRRDANSRGCNIKYKKW